SVSSIVDRPALPGALPFSLARLLSPLRFTLFPYTTLFRSLSFAINGAEQPVWDPRTDRFYLSIPQIGPNVKDGGVVRIYPTTSKIGRAHVLTPVTIRSRMPSSA